MSAHVRSSNGSLPCSVVLDYLRRRHERLTKTLLSLSLSLSYFVDHVSLCTHKLRINTRLSGERRRGHIHGGWLAFSCGGLVIIPYLESRPTQKDARERHLFEQRLVELGRSEKLISGRNVRFAKKRLKIKQHRGRRT